jgi:hypothetical protein
MRVCPRRPAAPQGPASLACLSLPCHVGARRGVLVHRWPSHSRTWHVPILLFRPGCQVRVPSLIRLGDDPRAHPAAATGMRRQSREQRCRWISARPVPGRGTHRGHRRSAWTVASRAATAPPWRLRQRARQRAPARRVHVALRYARHNTDRYLNDGDRGPRARTSATFHPMGGLLRPYSSCQFHHEYGGVWG